MNDKILNGIQYAVLLCWISGCIGGAATGNENLLSAGAVAFFITVVLNLMRS